MGCLLFVGLSGPGAVSYLFFFFFCDNLWFVMLL